MLFILTAFISQTMAQKTNYPTTAKVKQTDIYFGTSIEDPYRWLEASDSSAVADWVKAQNQVTDAYLKQIPFRD